MTNTKANAASLRNGHFIRGVNFDGMKFLALQAAFYID